MRLLVTGGTGVLGAALRPPAEAAGHAVLAPGHAELDLYDATAVGGAMRGVDAVLDLVAEWEAGRFAAAGRRGVVLRFGMPDGPGTGHDERVRRRGASVHVDDAATALLAALTVPSGIYDVCRDGERVSNRRFSETAGGRPAR